MYDPTAIKVGVKAIGYGVSVTAGAIIVNALMSILPKYNRELLLASSLVRGNEYYPSSLMRHQSV
jgi:hypothetical protein